MLIEVETQRIVTDQLSMPHSPRVVGDTLYALDSGRGRIIRIDPVDRRQDRHRLLPGLPARACDP